MADACDGAAGDVVEGIKRTKLATPTSSSLAQYEGQGSRAQSHPLPIAHSVVLRCGRPVLGVPSCSSARSIGLCRRTVAAKRSEHDHALPRSAAVAGSFIVTMIRPSADQEIDAKSLSAHLANHGIQMSPQPTFFQSGRSKQQFAPRMDIEHGQYDLLVMGGYSQPSGLNLSFGGTTYSILFVVENSDISVSIPRLIDGTVGPGPQTDRCDLPRLVDEGVRGVAAVGGGGGGGGRGYLFGRM